MSPITQAIAESLVSSNTKKVAEKRQTDEVAVFRPGPNTPNSLLRNSLTPENSLGFIKNHLQHALDEAFSSTSDNRPTANPEREAYQDSGGALTPLILADQVFSQSLGHFKSFSNANPSQNDDQVIQDFLARVRETYGTALREIINVMGHLGVMSPAVGRTLQEVDYRFKTNLKEIEPATPEPLLEELEAVIQDLDM